MAFVGVWDAKLYYTIASVLSHRLGWCMKGLGMYQVSVSSNLQVFLSCQLSSYVATEAYSVIFRSATRRHSHVFSRDSASPTRVPRHLVVAAPLHNKHHPRTSTHARSLPLFPIFSPKQLCAPEFSPFPSLHGRTHPLHPPTTKPQTTHHVQHLPLLSGLHNPRPTRAPNQILATPAPILVCHPTIRATILGRWSPTTHCRRRRARLRPHWRPHPRVNMGAQQPIRPQDTRIDTHVEGQRGCGVPLCIESAART